MASSPYLAWAAVILMIEGGCRRTEPAVGLENPESSVLTSSGMGYLAPPRASGVKTLANGSLLISGEAPVKATVEIKAPEGDQAPARADRKGVWSVVLPGDEAHLYAISAVIGARTVHAEGALVTAPGSLSQAVTVRAGYAAMPLVARPATDIATVDYDPQGSIAVAGDASAGAKLTLSVDGSPAALGKADAGGRYALVAANRRLTFGTHRLQVRSDARLADRTVTLTPPTPLSTPYQAWSTPQGWRVEWALNGGGVQTTLILSSPS